METPFFFRCNERYDLFGMLHSPERGSSSLFKDELGTVFCHPFAEEKMIAQRVSVNLARRLTDEGVYCLRFDEMGHGDSEGNFEDSTVETRLSDIQCAAEYLRDHTPVQNVGLIGIRLGATLAALNCVREATADFLVMVSPIVQGRSYIEQCLRSNLTTQMMTYGKIMKDRKALLADLMSGELVNIDGYLISKDLYQQIESIDLLNGATPSVPKTLVLQVSSKDSQPFERLTEELFARYKASNKETAIVNVRDDHFWKDAKVYKPRARNIEEAVVKWLHEVYPA